MAVDFLKLTGSKTEPYSIHNFVNYKKVPVEVVLEEAQALIYSLLRVREMRASAVITLAQEAFTAGLPTGFLEPLAMRDRSGIDVIPDRFVEEKGLLRRRSFDEDITTTLNGAVTAGATSIIVADRSVLPTTFPFTIKIDDEVMLATAGASTTLTVTRGYGGTTAAAHVTGSTVDGMLESGTPSHVAVFDELFQFDCKADEAQKYDLVFYKTPTLLGASNTTNFLTRRYPHLIRIGCQAGAASFSKDKQEKDDRTAELLALCMAANAESDMGRAA